MRAGRLTVHDFIVMPDHVHILLTVPGDLSIEKAMQWIKGSFSYRANMELGFKGEIWQRGFSDVRITDEQSFRRHREYIERRVHLWIGVFEEAEASGCFTGRRDEQWVWQGLKPSLILQLAARLKSCPDTELADLLTG